MAKVLYKQGLKATYLSLTERSANALYWCTDTRELFKGDDLYTDGVRKVANYSALPEFTAAADGKLYICNDNGNGYVLNANRDGWDIVIHGVDGTTIGFNENGLMAVKEIPVSAVSGLETRLNSVEQAAIAGAKIATAESAGIVKPDATSFHVAEDGTLALVSVPQSKVEGLETRLQNIEQSAVGGVHYMGKVDTFEDLPTDADQGDLYEVDADGSEWCWNGEQWFEYGSTKGLKPIARADLNEQQFVIDESNKLNLVAVEANIIKYKNGKLDEVLPRLFDQKMYDVAHGIFENTIVNYHDGEIRIMYAADSAFATQENTGGDASLYYMGLRAYAPEGAVNFKEDLAKTISDETLYSFENNDFAGIDKYGRKYSVIWLPVAALQEDQTWKYYGDNSADGKYIGWYYSVEWYNANGKVIGADTIRINLSNADCHTSTLPYYMDTFAKKSDIEDAITWQNI